jgi:drug/metabolite transporter (DMT)-like permease
MSPKPAAGFSRYDAGLVVVSAIWGTNYSVTKMALPHVAPLPFAAIRFVFSTGLLWIVVWAFRQHGPIPRKALWSILAWGVVGHTLNQAAFLNALRYSTATNSALIFGNLPVAVALIGIIMGYERPTARVWSGIALGTTGVVLLVGAKGFHFSGDSLKGDALNLAALVFWAMFTVGVRRVSMGYNPAQVTALTHLGGTPGLILAAAPAMGGVTLATLHPNVVIALAFAVVLSSVIASVLWTRSLNALGGNRTALYNCVTPIFAALAAWALLDERPVPLQAVGAGLVIAGVLASRAPVPDEAAG